MSTEINKKLHISYGGSTVAGKKPENQDALSAMLPEKHTVRKHKGAVACIADGVSVSSNARLASQTAVTNFVTDYYSTPDTWTVKQSARKVLTSINAWLNQQGKKSDSRSENFVTTFSAVIFKSHTAHIFHIGDSRIYLYRNEQLEKLTDDHFQIRADGNGYLTRALGVDAQLDVDYKQLLMKQGDIFIFTTDGVHEILDHDQLIQSLKQYPNSPEKAAKSITELALANNSQDNSSCLIVKVDELPIERLSEVHKQLSQLTIPPVLKVGNRIDHFVIDKILHSGTRSHVYLATNNRDKKQYVLKAPSENFSEDEEYLNAFIKEQWVGRKIDNPRVMKIYPHPENSKFWYHICEYMPGQTLRQWIIDHPYPLLSDVRAIVKEMVAAVRVLHRNNIIHRDLKPENFMIDENNHVCLIDLGTTLVAGLGEIKTAISEETPVGDIGYIAPEYLLQNSATRSSDLFALGCIAYEMLTGELPYNAIKSNYRYPTKLDSWKYKNIKFSGELQNYPHWINAVLKKATHRDIRQRYSAMSEFITELSSPSAETLKSINHAPLIERNPVKVWQGITLILLAVLIIQFLYYQNML